MCKSHGWRYAHRWLYRPTTYHGCFKEKTDPGAYLDLWRPPHKCGGGIGKPESVDGSGLIDEVEGKAELFKKHLRHPAVTEIRNVGLLMAVEFESFEIVKAVIDRALELGVLTDWFLFHNNCMRLAPPLIITEPEIHMACDIILSAVEDVLYSEEKRKR